MTTLLGATFFSFTYYQLSQLIKLNNNNNPIDQKRERAKRELSNQLIGSLIDTQISKREVSKANISIISITSILYS